VNRAGRLPRAAARPPGRLRDRSRRPARLWCIAEPQHRAAGEIEHGTVVLVNGRFTDGDWRNWRTRVFGPAARAAGVTRGRAAGVTRGRPYDLRHSAASLWLYRMRDADVDAWIEESVMTRPRRPPIRAPALHVAPAPDLPTAGRLELTADMGRH